MRWHRPGSRPLRSDWGTAPGAVAGIVTALTLGTAFALGAVGVSWAWVAYPLGFGGLMPVAVGVAARRRSADPRGRTPRYDARTGADDDIDDALSTLRDRYARGDLDEAAFEARLERLLRTEDPAAAREYVRPDDGDRPADRGSTGSRATSGATSENRGTP